MRWEDCSGYTLAEDISKVEKTMKFLLALKEVEKDFHFVVYIIEQVEMIVMGNEMSEEYEDEEMAFTDLDDDSYFTMAR